MPEPTFSIVIAAHNAARTLPSTVRSVLAQTRQDFEIVVVDDGSTDGTEDALREATTDGRVAYVRQENLGPATARNVGIERSVGEFVSLLDSDDVWLPHYLQAMASALEADPGAGLAFTDAWRLDEETRRIHRRTIMSQQHPPNPPPREPQRLVAALLERNFVYTSATVRRQVLRDVGGFRTLTRSEDYELWLRIAASGTRFVNAGEVLAVYRDRPGSRIHDGAAMLRGRTEIYRLVLETYDVEPEIRELARERLRATGEQLAALEEGAGQSRGHGGRGALRRYARDRRLFRTRPPRSVAEAFPDLRAI